MQLWDKIIYSHIGFLLWLWSTKQSLSKCSPVRILLSSWHITVTHDVTCDVRWFLFCCPANKQLVISPSHHQIFCASSLIFAPHPPHCTLHVPVVFEGRDRRPTLPYVPQCLACSKSVGVLTLNCRYSRQADNLVSSCPHTLQGCVILYWQRGQALWVGRTKNLCPGGSPLPSSFVPSNSAHSPAYNPQASESHPAEQVIKLTLWGWAKGNLIPYM